MAQLSTLLLPTNPSSSRWPVLRRRCGPVRAFQPSDFDGFAKRVASGDAVKDAWRSANKGFEQLSYESRKFAERMDRQFEVSRRVETAARVAVERIRELDYELGIGRRWRTFSVDFSRNWPRYSKELKGFAETPIGRAFVTIFFLWFALSGGLFNFLALATLLLPLSSFLLGNIANKMVIQGTCPACGTQFVGNRNQVVQCRGCGNIVWQPKQDSKGKGKTGRSSYSEPEIIDIEIEEK
ncbi:replicase polyprotein 1ab protein [Wolffia australiana]